MYGIYINWIDIDRVTLLHYSLHNSYGNLINRHYYRPTDCEILIIGIDTIVLWLTKISFYNNYCSDRNHLFIISDVVDV